MKLFLSLQSFICHISLFLSLQSFIFGSKPFLKNVKANSEVNFYSKIQIYAMKYTFDSGQMVETNYKTVFH